MGGNAMKKNMYVAIIVICILFVIAISAVAGYKVGCNKAFNQAKVVYEERKGTKWCYVLTDNNVSAYDCSGTGGKEE
jgi:hypothetical protein